MNTKRLLSLYGLKWNPFSVELPAEALVETKKIEHFCWRVENLAQDGGVALLTGDAGVGKSVALRQVAARLGRMTDVSVSALSRPQSAIGDFYRELGAAFGIELRAHNRWGGFLALRQKWQTHIASTLHRPVLLIDEAQEMPTAVLSELRLLSSMHFDSQVILTTVLCGDSRLLDKMTLPELIPLGSRIRVRLTLEPWGKEELTKLLAESLTRAGAPKLMSKDLRFVLVEHAAASPRILMNMAHELLMLAAERELTELDEGLYLEAFAPTQNGRIRKRGV